MKIRKAGTPCRGLGQTPAFRAGTSGWPLSVSRPDRLVAGRRRARRTAWGMPRPRSPASRSTRACRARGRIVGDGDLGELREAAPSRRARERHAGTIVSLLLEGVAGDLHQVRAPAAEQAPNPGGQEVSVARGGAGGPYRRRSRASAIRRMTVACGWAAMALTTHGGGRAHVALPTGLATVPLISKWRTGESMRTRATRPSASSVDLSGLVLALPDVGSAPARASEAGGRPRHGHAVDHSGRGRGERVRVGEADLQVGDRPRLARQGPEDLVQNLGSGSRARERSRGCGGRRTAAKEDGSRGLPNAARAADSGSSSRLPGKPVHDRAHASGLSTPMPNAIVATITSSSPDRNAAEPVAGWVLCPRDTRLPAPAPRSPWPGRRPPCGWERRRGRRRAGRGPSAPRRRSAPHPDSGPLRSRCSCAGSRG